MRSLALSLAAALAVGGCATPEAPRHQDQADAVPHVGPPEGFQPAERFDPDDVASMRRSRDAWVAAFAAGDAEALAFVFQQDAVMALPDDIAALSAEAFFATYDAAIAFDEPLELFITDGGDPRVMTKLPWVSYYGDYTLTLTPKAGGEPIQNSGRFMTRFHRQPDGSLQVIHGPSVGDPAPAFSLERMRGDGEVRLAELLGERPTVLVFGSYT